MDILRTKIDIIVSNEVIDDIMATALECGASWRSEAYVEDGEDLRECAASERISKGVELWFLDKEEDSYVILDREKLLRGLRRYVEAGNTDCICRREGRNDPRAGELEINPGTITSYMADSIIQYGLFGKMLYGQEAGNAGC